MRPLYIAAFLVTAMLTYGLYSMKYEVQRSESDLHSLQTKLGTEREALRVLRAEWSYLNNPERLQKLAARHLVLAPVSLHRVAALNHLPFKEVPSEVENRVQVPVPSKANPVWNRTNVRSAGISDGER